MVFITNNRMRLTLLFLVLCAVHVNTKRTKKVTPDADVIEKTKAHVKQTTKPAQKAIIAIEIVDPNDNSTKHGKGKKRTIESALGYGYQTNNAGYENFFNVKPKPPKYQIYKYSQQDIPAYKGPSKYVPTETFNSGYSSGHTQQGHGNIGQISGHQGHGGQFEIQKSVQYDLGSTQPVYIPNKHAPNPNLQQYYQNGATLFSSLDNNGHLSSLSSQAPSNHGPMVPVIIFRVYTNQLANGAALHPNIPSGHPYANLNNVDLQRLLSGYVQKNQPQYYKQSQHAQVHQQQVYPSQTPHQVQLQPQHGHAQQQIYYQQGHQQQQHSLETNENYPDDAHTKVIFHKDKTVKYEAPAAHVAQKFKITIPENTFSKVEVQEHTYAEPNVQYVQPHVHYAQQHYESQEQPEQQQYAQQQDGQYYYPQVYQQEYQQSVQYTQTQQVPQTQHGAQETSGVTEYDAKQYVQIAYANDENQQQAEQPIDTQGHLQQVQPNQQYYQQQYVQYEAPAHSSQAQVAHVQQNTQYSHRAPEHSGENQDYSLVKHSNDAGRDLNPKLYNYHAHPNQRGTQKRKRERKQRIPLVLAPEVRESVDSKNKN